MRQRTPREENEKHRKFIATCPCLICDRTDVQCAHIRYADPTIGKELTGMGQKSDDKYTVPLCVHHHAAQHAWGNEREWWERYGIDPIKVALELFSVTGRLERALNVIGKCREQLAA